LKYCIYGNPTIDIVTENNHSRYVAYGGGSYYSSLPLIKRGISVEVYASYNTMLEEHPISKYIVKQQFATSVNIFELEYHGFERKLKVRDVAPKIYEWNTHIDLCNVIVNPVLGEVSVNLLRNIKSKSTILAVDLQGFLRRLVDGNITLTYNPEVEAVLEIADVVHADLDEYIALTRSRSSSITSFTNPRNLRGVLVVTVRPSKILIFTRSLFKVIEFKEDYYAPIKTGAGDYFLATYTHSYYETGDAEESAFLAHEETTYWLKERSTAGLHRAPTTQFDYFTCNLKNTSL
jgi:hypothetical protein